MTKVTSRNAHAKTILAASSALCLLAATSSHGATITITDAKVFSTVVPAPCELHFTPDHIAWIEEIAANRIGRFDPATNTVTDTDVPAPIGVPGGEAIGTDGGVWFGGVASNEIYRLDPSTLQITQIAIPVPLPGVAQQALARVQTLLGNAHLPTGVAVSDAAENGPDNALWITEVGNNAIGRVDYTTHEVTSFPIPTPLAAPLIIHRGPGNTMVFPEAAAGKVATINITTHQFTEYTVPTPGAVPQGVTTAADGTIWFTETAGQKIGHIDPATGTVTEYPIGQFSNLFLPRPGPLIFGPDGNLYVAEGNLDGGSNIGQFNTATHIYVDYRLPTLGGSVCDLAPDSIQGNKIYFSEFLGQKVGVLTIGP